ncbi:MAG: VanZ family protein [Maribacter sp.]
MVFVTSFSLFSFDGVQASRFDIPHMDKLVHFTFYFGVVITGSMAFIVGRVNQSKGTLLKRLWYLLVFAISYGILIEVIQHVFTVNRQGDPLDALANSMGAFSGMLLISFLFLKKLSLK